jgi:hypothetical protein
MQNMASSNQIPSSLLKQAKCIAVIPKMTKAGFIVGGKHGNGVVSCRTKSGWSAPAFISMTGGSVGLQAGAEKQDIVLLMNSQGEQELRNGHWELGGEAAAAGPSGGEAADTSTGWKPLFFPMQVPAELSRVPMWGAQKSALIKTRFVKCTVIALHSNPSWTARCSHHHPHSCLCRPCGKWQECNRESVRFVSVLLRKPRRSRSICVGLRLILFRNRQSVVGVLRELS